MLDGQGQTWPPEPDRLLERLTTRARLLLAAERSMLAHQADSTRVEVVQAILADQQNTIDDLRAACASLHAQAAANAAMEPPPVVKISAAPSTNLTALEAELLQLRRELASVYASTSWTITAPVRALRRLVGGR